MTQPTPFSRSADYSNDELNNVTGRSTLRTAALDAELDAIALTLAGTLASLAQLQRDDGKIRDYVVEPWALSTDARALLAIGTSTTLRGAWVTGTVYALRDVVSQAGSTYICAIAHNAGVFATDLAANRWLLVSAPGTTSLSASSVTFTPAGNISATTVQAALAELDSEKAAKSANLSDLTSLPTALANLGALPIAGGTMTGAITLAADPAAALQPVTRQYAEALRARASPLLPAVALRMATTGTSMQVSVSATQALLANGAGGYASVTLSFTLTDLSVAASGFGSGREAGLTLTAATWYHVWAVSDAAGGNTRLILSTSSTAPNLTGLTSAALWGYVGALYATSSSVFRASVQTGLDVVQAETAMLTAATATALTSVSIGSLAPALARRVRGWGITSGAGIFCRLNSNASSAGLGAQLIGSQYGVFDLLMDVPQTIYYLVSAGSITASVTGWSY